MLISLSFEAAIGPSGDLDKSLADPTELENWVMYDLATIQAEPDPWTRGAAALTVINRAQPTPRFAAVPNGGAWDDSL